MHRARYSVQKTFVFKCHLHYKMSDYYRRMAKLSEFKISMKFSEFVAILISKNAERATMP